jgi:hypothetical protein
MNISAPLCAATADASFGPVVDAACRDGFDFTLLFEQSIFVLLPASLLLLVAPLRLLKLRKASVKVTDNVSRAIKLVSCSPWLPPMQTATIIKGPKHEN